MHGLTGGQLKYGPVTGQQNPGTPVTIAAAMQFRNASGRFVFMSSGVANICISTSTVVFGFMDCEDFLTVAGDMRSCIIASDVIFRLPVNAGTFVVATHVGNAYDLTQATLNGVTLTQGVDLTATTRKLVIVVGGDDTNNEWVDVIMNPSKRAA